MSHKLSSHRQHFGSRYGAGSGNNPPYPQILPRICTEAMAAAWSRLPPEQKAERKRRKARASANIAVRQEAVHLRESRIVRQPRSKPSHCTTCKEGSMIYVICRPEPSANLEQMLPPCSETVNASKSARIFLRGASARVCARLRTSARVCASLRASAQCCARLRASACGCVRLRASACGCVRLRASTCVCARLRASACFCARLRASACVCVRLRASACI